MTGISTSIELYDKVTAPINKMIGAMGNLMNAFDNVQTSMDSTFDTSAFEDARNQLGQAALEMQELGNNTNNTSQAVGGLTSKLVGMAVSAVGLKKAMDVSDELMMTTSRINLMNDGLQTTDELMTMIYQSAQDSRGSFNDMASVVARFGNNAKDAFSSSKEVVAFANIIQKQMTIAGASTAEASNAMLQLSQALGSGVLRGDELNSIFEQAPNLIQSIADYMNVPIGEIRKMASEGQLTADIVKNAIFASADDVNAKFAEIPMTWNQLWTKVSNSALMHLQPLLIGINKVANFVSENWSIIAPILLAVASAIAVYTVATKGAELATLAWAKSQAILKAIMGMTPLAKTIMLITIIIGLIFAVASAIAKLTGVATTGFGVITGGINVVIQFFKNLGMSVANIALGIGGVIGGLCTNMMVAFQNAIGSIKSWFYSLLSTALTVIAGICEGLNKLPFVEFDFSGITSKAEEYANKAAEATGNKGEYVSLMDEFVNGMSTFDDFKTGWASEAFASGAEWGDNFANKHSFGGGGFGSEYGFGTEDELLNGVNDIANSTGSMADSLDVTSEDLKYLRDIAERDVINRFTTAEIKIEQTNNNNIGSNMDIDGFMSKWNEDLEEIMMSSAEGVHS